MSTIYLPNVNGDPERPLCLPEDAAPVAAAAGPLWHAFADDVARSMHDDYRDTVIVGQRSAWQHPAAGLQGLTLLVGGGWWRVRGERIERARKPSAVGAFKLLAEAGLNGFSGEPCTKARWSATYDDGDIVCGGAETFLAHPVAHGVHDGTLIGKVLRFLGGTDIGCFVDMAPLYDAGVTPMFGVHQCSL